MRPMFAAMFLFSIALRLVAGDEPAPQELQVRLLGDGARVVLSRGERLVAMAQVRAFLPDDVAPIVLPDAWSQTEALNPDGEALRSVTVGREDQAAASVLVRANRTRGGVRLLISPDAVEGESPRLELVIQVFSGEVGVLPELAAVDALLPGQRTIDPPVAGGKPFRALRLTVLRGGDRRLELARSAPAEWTLHKVDGSSVVVRQRLLPDPRRPGQPGTFVLYLGEEWDGGTVRISPVRLGKRQTPSGDFVEGFARVYANGADPYAFDEVSVMVEVARPDGTLQLRPCFFWEGPSASPAEGEFRFRFAPLVPGVYGVRLRVLQGGRETYTEAQVIEAGPRASRGFVHVRAGERFLRFLNGDLFIPVGVNLAWPPEKGDAGWYREAFGTLTRNRANAARVWLSSWGMPLEGPRAGRFDPDVAAALDDLFTAAQARDVYVTLVIENAHDLATKFEQHPYARTMGGPLPAAVEFFKGQVAEQLFKRRLTYLAARYGAFRSLLGWELLNELDEVWPELKTDPDDPRRIPIEADRARAARRSTTQWVARMAQHLKSMDGGLRPVTVSTALSPEEIWPELEQLAEIDWLSPHGYVPEAMDARQDRELDETRLLTDWADASRGVGRPHKPYWLGEFGYRAADDSELKQKGPAAASAERNARDAGGLLLHNSLMAGLASGQAGTPLHWWWDRYIALNSLWKLYRGPGLFAAGLERLSTRDGLEQVRTLTNAGDNDTAVRILGRVGRTGMCLWLQDKRSTWAARLDRDEGPPPEVSGFEFRAPALSPGTYRATWLEVWKGEELRCDEVTVAPVGKDGAPVPVVLEAPAFQRDTAVLIEPKQ